MADRFRVEPAGLTATAGRLAVLAGSVAGLDLAGPLEQATAAVGGSGLAGQSGVLAAGLSATDGRLSSAVAGMGTAADAAAANYVSADSAVASMFASLMSGLPALVAVPR